MAGKRPALPSVAAIAWGDDHTTSPALRCCADVGIAFLNLCAHPTPRQMEAEQFTSANVFGEQRCLEREEQRQALE